MDGISIPCITPAEALTQLKETSVSTLIGLGATAAATYVAYEQFRFWRSRRTNSGKQLPGAWGARLVFWTRPVMQPGRSQGGCCWADPVPARAHWGGRRASRLWDFFEGLRDAEFQRAERDEP